jgi:predicted  nucleic acid-binding Zn-ribbon protein
MPNSSVGGVTVSVKLDDRDALKQLDSLRDKIEAAEKALSAKREKRDSLAVEASEAARRYEDLARAVEAAYKRAEEARTAIDAGPKKEQLAYYQEELKAANRDLAQAQKELAKQDAIVTKLTGTQAKLNQEIADEESKLDGMTNRAATLEKQVAASTGTMAKLSTATGKATKKMEAAFARLGRMIRKVFVLTVILAALRAFREYLSGILESTPEFSAALGELKSALLTLAQPLISIIIPAFVQLLQILTRVVTVLAALVSRIFGTTFEQSQEAAKALYEQADAYKKTGNAAQKASRQLAAFDQLNVLSDNSSGGGGAAASGSTPQFNLDAAGVETDLDKILNIVELIGAALLGWKIGSALGLDLGKILGLFLLLYGTAHFVGTYLEAWDEGITWDNLKTLLEDIAIMAAGAFLLFGKLGAALALILGGLSLVTLAFHDMNENGMTLQNTLTLIAGLFAAGLGLSILTGSFIPLALAALASLIVWLVYAFDEGEEFTEGMKKIFGGLGQFFKSIFAGDVEGAIEGLKVALEGLKQAGAAVGRALKKAWQELLNWLGQKLGPEWKAFFERIGGYFGAWIANLKLGLNGIITFIKGVFTGDLELAMQGVRDVGIAVGNSLLEFMAIVTNGFVDAINVLIGGLNSIVGDIPDWVELFGLIIPGLPTALVSLKGFQTLPHWTPPRLAQGAVIPPNREFMAVLGDQKSGTNIETPLETMVQAFRQALNEGGGGDLHLQVYVGDDKVTDTVIRGINRRARAGGRAIKV